MLVVPPAKLSQADTVAKFTIQEPLGVSWKDEWLSQTVTVQSTEDRIPVRKLQLLRPDQQPIPAQFRVPQENVWLQPEDMLRPGGTVEILFRASLDKNQSAEFSLNDEGDWPPPWQRVEIRGTRTGDTFTVVNEHYRLTFNPSQPRPINEIVCTGNGPVAGPFSWPREVSVTGVEDIWLQRGPAMAKLQRQFHFENPNQKYVLTLTFRAGDPWIDVADDYSFPAGSALKLDLRVLEPDIVYHEYAYNARTFKAGGPKEDSTLQPPQHPIATLGPIWRDIWYNGGPFAFVYQKNAPCGIGFAAVQGSQWHTPSGITPESQNLEIHGDPDTAGQVELHLPADGGRRRWAIIIGPPDLRNDLSRLTRSHADIPLNTVLKDWILDWESDAPGFEAGAAGVYLGSHFNRHFFNPTTYPRRVKGQVEQALEKSPVKSSDLAVLAYIFTDPDYWPGPDHQWSIGNPNFHTDMYNIPLKIGLAMPDHPHAARWVQYGVRETHGNLMRDSYPGGAWAESLSYSKYFFDVGENAALLQQHGVTNAFAHWPRLRQVANYLALMHTPVDPRYGRRQIAPIGDTSPDNFSKKLHHLAPFFEESDPDFARQLQNFPNPSDHPLDISSRAFPGFGAMLRGNAYDPLRESFVTIKAGPARNHYQGDELSFHFCSLGTPLAIDHACHYSPRPWHAAIHNRPDMNNLRPVGVGQPLAFRSSEQADLFVAEETTTRMSHVPIEPHEAVKPGWEYPTTFLPESTPWRFRRYALLVKHGNKKSAPPDYLVLYDQIDSPQPPWWNLHVLGRNMSAEEEGIYEFEGQLGVDLSVHVLEGETRDVALKKWGWSGPSNKRRELKGQTYEQQAFGQMIPEDFQRGTWSEKKGEQTLWLRLKGPAGTSHRMVVLMPHNPTVGKPKVQHLRAGTVQISWNNEIEVIHLGPDAPHAAAIERSASSHVLLPQEELKRF